MVPVSLAVSGAILRAVSVAVSGRVSGAFSRPVSRRVSGAISRPVSIAVSGTVSIPVSGVDFRERFQWRFQEPIHNTDFRGVYVSACEIDSNGLRTLSDRGLMGFKSYQGVWEPLSSKPRKSSLGGRLPDTGSPCSSARHRVRRHRKKMVRDSTRSLLRRPAHAMFAG